jgi:hypothetical protein
MAEFELAHMGDVDDQEPRGAGFWTVAVYECDRRYGGPEEGGWWFDCGERVAHLMADDLAPRVFTDQDKAYEYATDLQGRLDVRFNNDGENRDLNSVNCEGRYCAEVHEGFAPAHYPETRPYYE